MSEDCHKSPKDTQEPIGAPGQEVKDSGERVRPHDDSVFFAGLERTSNGWQVIDNEGFINHTLDSAAASLCLDRDWRDLEDVPERIANTRIGVFRRTELLSVGEDGSVVRSGVMAATEQPIEVALRSVTMARETRVTAYRAQHEAAARLDGIQRGLPMDDDLETLTLALNRANLSCKAADRLVEMFALLGTLAGRRLTDLHLLDDEILEARRILDRTLETHVR